MQQCALHEKVNVTQINAHFITYVLILLYFFYHCCSVLYHVSLITFFITLWLTNVTDTGKCLLESFTDLDKLWLIFLLRFLKRNSKDRIKLNSKNSKHWFKYIASNDRTQRIMTNTIPKYFENMHYKWKHWYKLDRYSRCKDLCKGLPMDFLFSLTTASTQVADGFSCFIFAVCFISLEILRKKIFTFPIMCICLYLSVGLCTWLPCLQRPEYVRSPTTGVTDGCEQFGLGNLSFIRVPFTYEGALIFAA